LNIYLRSSAVEYFFNIFIRLIFGRLEIEFLQNFLYAAAAHRLAYFRRPEVIAFLSPRIDLLEYLQLPLFEGAQPLPDFGY